MDLNELLIPGISIIAPIMVLFLVRGLESGKRSVINETKLVQVMEEIPNVRENVKEIFKQLGELRQQVAILNERTAGLR